MAAAMDISWPLFLLLLLLLWMIIVRVHEAVRKFPPSCVGFPVLGRVPMILWRSMRSPRSNFFRELTRDGMSKGDVWSTMLGMRRFIVLSSYEAVVEALSRQGHTFSFRPRMTDYFSYRSLDDSDVANPRKVGGLIFSSGEVWRDQRRFALSVMRDLGMGKNVTERKIQIEARCLTEELREISGTAFAPSLILTRAVSNVISQFVFGFRSQKEDYEFEQFNRSMKQLVQESNGSFLVPLFFPFLENTFLSRLFAQQVSGTEENMIAFTARKISQVEDKLASDSDLEPENFVSAFLRKQKIEGRSHSFCRRQLILSVYDLFVAGSETTSTFLNWAMLYLAKHVDWQRALHEEVDTELGALSDISFADRLRCHKTQAFIDEVQRHACIVPHNLGHAVAKECFFRGYRISEDAYIIPSIYNVHFDPKLWPMPHKFDPSRHLSDSGDFQASKVIIPFGVGKRACLGESLARMEIFIFLSSILKNFHVTLDEEAEALKDDIFVGSDIDIHAPKDHKVILTARA